MKIINSLEECLKHALQREFILQNKHTSKNLRKGKFLLYTIKDFYIMLLFINNKQEQKSYNMPVPYNVYLSDDSVIFDYTLDTLCYEREDLKEYVISCGKSRSPFYNSTLEMLFV